MSRATGAFGAQVFLLAGGPGRAATGFSLLLLLLRRKGELKKPFFFCAGGSSLADDMPESAEPLYIFVGDCCPLDGSSREVGLV